eukprot:scaffold197991_cov31-Tisochrysis_lutea.AAC.2
MMPDVTDLVSMGLAARAAAYAPPAAPKLRWAPPPRSARARSAGRCVSLSGACPSDATNAPA